MGISIPINNMSIMRVKINAGWEDTDSVTRRIKEQFLTKDISNDIIFVNDDSYDIIAFNNYVNEEVNKGAKSCIFFHEPTWSGNHQRTFNGVDDLVIFGYSKDKYNINNNVFVESPAKMFYGGRGPWTEGHSFWTYENIINNPFNKTKNISSVVSPLGSDGNYGPDGCLYKERSTLISELIKEIEFIDFYGWGTEKSNLKGHIGEKKDGLIDYKFSLCIENSHEKNYITEKFFDCILTNTIPIYYGCSNIKDLIPENCYILIDDIENINSVKELLIDINNNCDEIYQNMLPNLLNFKTRYFEDFNPLKDIIKLLKNG